MIIVEHVGGIENLKEHNSANSEYSWNLNVGW